MYNAHYLFLTHNREYYSSPSLFKVCFRMVCKLKNKYQSWILVFLEIINSTIYLIIFQGKFMIDIRILHHINNTIIRCHTKIVFVVFFMYRWRQLNLSSNNYITMLTNFPSCQFCCLISIILFESTLDKCCCPVFYTATTKTARTILLSLGQHNTNT